LFDHDLRFAQARKPLPIQALVSELAVETLDDAVSSMAAQRDIGRTDVLVLKPTHDCGGFILGAVV
jgi:hypothetical protein